MHNFWVVYFLAVAFCLVICVSATAEVSQADATAAVKNAEGTVKAVCQRAQNKINNAKDLLKKVESSKDEAAEAILQAEKAAKGTPKAEDIVKKVKEFAQAVATSYPEEKEKLDKAVISLTPFLKEAQELDKRSSIDITPNDSQENNFSETNEKAKALKSEATVLNGNITEAEKLLAGVDVKANEMEQNAKKAQIAHSHVIAIVGVVQIETMIVKADAIIGDIQSKNNDVNDIVQAIKKHCKNRLIESNTILKNKCSTANDPLTSATSAVEEATNAKGEIEKQKGLAETALTNVKKSETGVTTAQQEANTAYDCVSTAQQNCEQLNNALRTVKTSLTTANDLKKEMETALSKATSEERTNQTKEKEKEADPQVGEGTVSNKNDATIKPTSIDLPDQSHSSTDKLKDALSTGAQNVPTTALTGGKAPAPGANNDNAMTVFVPLLVALIASAVLQKVFYSLFDCEA